MRRTTLSLFISLVLVAATLTHAQAATTTTVSFVAHQDDDLLFMNPDIASDVQAGYNVWVVYLTAGEVHTRDPLSYANQRIEGERAAYARTANVANNWTYEEMWFNGHPVATNRLDGTNVRLVFTFIHGASGGCDDGGDPQGDLYKMLHDGPYVARPIDGRPAYTRATFVGMLHSILDRAKPDYIRSGSSIGHRDRPNPDHVDHVAAAILTAEADLDGARRTWIRRDEYTGYNSRAFPENVSGYWRDRKIEIWDQYWPHDPEVARLSHDYAFSRQIRPEGRIFWPGTPWVPPGDFAVAGC
ncbi:PIG-L family deacetylase [Lentzea sp.]|uniref:PIG-L family deacetylase n=1 Tax=Lentzea sp. TaxID=56099 RepID=UPI002BC93D71|nr:PIG-L family deacetylase [Lentzea sp.]HUQ61123.1 PIG-L family deacetylase [Lentzea sp.]